MNRQDLLALHESLSTEARELMVKKNTDYGANADPYRNFRTFGELGILVRLSDKISRLQSFLENGGFAVKEEGLHDTVLDIINYAVLFEGFVKDAAEKKAV